MATQTATIRVSRKTRDLLAGQARERGVSLAAMLTDIAQKNQLEAMFASEREASRRDAENPEAMAEMREWDDFDDGVDYD